MEAHECDACLAPGTKAALGAAWRDWTGQEGVSTVAGQGQDAEHRDKEARELSPSAHQCPG